MRDACVARSVASMQERGLTEVIGRVQIAAWVIVLAVIGFYVAGLVMSVFNPLEMWLFTAVVIVLVVLFVLHARRIRRVMRDQDEPGHGELHETLNRMRETRGF
jgi:membrane protein implicated in regulation of membrane protease activity